MKKLATLIVVLIINSPLFIVGQNVKDSQVTQAVPTKLLYFNAQHVGAIVQVKWTTVKEINSDRYIVEKSVDGVSFVETGEIEGIGNSDFPRKYVFSDKNPKSAYKYYRLKEVDFDGNIVYNKIAILDKETDINEYVSPLGNAERVLTILTHQKN